MYLAKIPQTSRVPVGKNEGVDSELRKTDGRKRSRRDEAERERDKLMFVTDKK